jgi:molybdopterin-dependent oxidoreductase alpha subunit
MHENQGLNYEFINTYTNGFNEFRDSLQNISWTEICSRSGISEAEIRQAAEIFCTAKRVIACWAMGLTQHHDGVATIKQVVNLLLLGGHLGRRGAGVCPVRGHSNVQGDKTMGITENPPAYLLKNLATNFEFTPPTLRGIDTIDTIQGLHNGTIKTLVTLGGNLLMASPDTNYTAQALENAELTVHIATKLNHTHLHSGKVGLLLPCLSRSEQDIQNGHPQMVSVENSMGIVHRSSGVLQPSSAHLLSEVAIICNLAAELLPKSTVPWRELINDYNQIRELISQNIPGFLEFNLKLVNPGWFYLPNSVRDDCSFATKDLKAQFSTNPGIKSGSLAADEFLLMTIRSHDQFNTTVSGHDDRYRGIHGGRQILFMNANDMIEQGFSDGQSITLSNSKYPQMQLENLQIVSYDIPRKCLASYFPEANVLIPLDSLGEQSNTPTSKSIVVKLRS